jgi:thiol-disulfide isomerase/thioredoxin
MKIFREIAILIFIVWIGSTVISYIRAPKLDSDTLPHIEGILTDGTHFDSSHLRGKPLMVEFWGTWCPVCKQQASNVASVAEKYNVITIAVNSRSDGYINKWLSEHKVKYPVLNDPNGKWAKRFKVPAYPTTFFFDAQGKLKFTEVGYTTTAGMVTRLKMSK